MNPLTQQVDALAVGRTPTAWPVIEQRDPTPSDIYYPIGQFWINQGSSRLWYLQSKSNASGVLQATWELISVSTVLVSLSDTANTPVFPSSNSATPPDNIQLVGGSGITVVSTPASNLLTITNTGSASTETLTGDDTVAVSPSGGTIQTLGNVVANATHSKALFTTNPSGNIERWDIQLSAAIASTNVANVGLAAFSSAQFTVDENGFVQLKGGSTPPVLSFTMSDTNNEVPNGSGVFNILGFGSITTLGSANTCTVELTGLTNHNVLIGAGSATITKVAPSATSGIPLISQGSTSDPTFGTAVVAGGGTGDTSFTAFSPICGGTTTTGALQSASTGMSNVGYVLTSTGTGSLPTWQAASASGSVTQLTAFSGSNPVVPSSGNINVFGAGSITTVGSANTVTVQLTGMTANNLLYGQGSTTLGLIAPGTTGQVLQTNTGSFPTWSTATYPSITTINQLLYSSSNNTVAGLTAANSATLVSTSAGVPVWSSTMTNGQIIIGSTGATPTAATLTQGTGITITNGAGSITIASANGVPVVGLTPDTTVGGGVSPVVPASGTGLIKITSGAAFSTGTLANSIRTDTTSANTINFELQYAGTSSGLTPIANNYGIAQFNSNNFTVSAGLVTSQAITINTAGSITGGGSVNLGGSITLTGASTGFPWSDEAAGFNAASNNGYFCTASLTATLPGSPAMGDVVRIVSDTSSVITIQANTGQKIRIGNVINSATGGTAVSTRIGDAIDLVYRTTDATWYVFDNPVGTWGLS